MWRRLNAGREPSLAPPNPLPAEYGVEGEGERGGERAEPWHMRVGQEEWPRRAVMAEEKGCSARQGRFLSDVYRLAGLTRQAFLTEHRENRYSAHRMLGIPCLVVPTVAGAR